METTQRHGYSAVQIGLHWLIAALVFFQLLFGESMTEVVDAAEEGETASSTDILLGGAHYWVGISILALVALRLAVRIRQGASAAPMGGRTWMDYAAAALHGLFYVLLFAVPISGLLTIYVSDEIGDIHALAKPIFIVLIVVHAGAALFHQFIMKDGTLRRILVPAR